MNPGSVYSIKMVASLFSGIMVNAYWQHEFVIVILAHHWSDGVRYYWIHVSVTSCFTLRHFEQCTLHFWCVTTRGSNFYSSPAKPYVLEGLRFARPHVAGIARTFLDTENVWLLPWLARSRDLSPIESVWSMVAKRLARHYTPVNTVDELWLCDEDAWAFVPIYAIQSLTQSPGV
ncbi:hypothetical protein TNCV_4272171 [Trichonephila clavipes]|nr:hypothetical protein TNCV_4272171 [Trichonephila clavipes]